MGTVSGWTTQRERELAIRYQAGEAVIDIAAAFGVSVSTVRGRISSLGLLRRTVKRSGVPIGGNAAWLLGAALRAGIDTPRDAFASDLLTELDEQPFVLAASEAPAA